MKTIYDNGRFVPIEQPHFTKDTTVGNPEKYTIKHEFNAHIQSLMGDYTFSDDLIKSLNM